MACTVVQAARSDELHHHGDLDVAVAPGHVHAHAVHRVSHGVARRFFELLPDLGALDVLCDVQRALIRGDASSLSIAAASIVAKVLRDALMSALDLAHPGYDLARNMGYASEEHRMALRKLGPSPIHRRTFGDVSQRWLFS